MNTLNKTDYFAFDFDGVIADSILECMISGYNAYAHIKGTLKRKYDIEDFSDSEILDFRRLRNFIRSGEDYVYIMLSFDLGIPIQSQADWDHFTAQYAELKESYYSAFYESRNHILDSFKEKWLALNPLYPGIKEFISHIPVEHIFIVTTKDVHFVKEILTANGITLIDKQMYQAVKGLKKPQIILNILSDFNISSEKLIFIDDHAQTVLDVSETAVNCYLSGWGYNTIAQQKRLKGLGIPILKISDII